jgi:hypothetical protein
MKIARAVGVPLRTVTDSKERREKLTEKEKRSVLDWDLLDLESE